MKIYRLDKDTAKPIIDNSPIRYYDNFRVEV